MGRYLWAIRSFEDLNPISGSRPCRLGLPLPRCFQGLHSAVYWLKEIAHAKKTFCLKDFGKLPASFKDDEFANAGFWSLTCSALSALITCPQHRHRSAPKNPVLVQEIEGDASRLWGRPCADTDEEDMISAPEESPPSRGQTSKSGVTAAVVGTTAMSW